MELPINKIIQGDSLEVLKTLPDESVDCIITDPPYMISQNKNISRKSLNNKHWNRGMDIKLDFGEWDKFESDSDFLEFTENWFKECARVLKSKGWIYIFFDKQKTGFFDLYLSKKYGIKSRTIFTWLKSNPVPSFRKVNWLSSSEFIWVGSKGESKLKNFKQQKEMFNYMITPNSSSYGETEHPTEKPIKLIKHLIEVNSNEGDIILDCFMGSGTTAVACLLTGRKFIGIEKDETYFKMANERIKPYLEQQKL